MYKAAIITVGDEVMEGLIEDSNASYLSRFLVTHGVLPYKRISVADRIDQIIDVLNFCKDCQLVVLSGGLGPTDDDLTRIAVAKFLEKELIFEPKIWQTIVDFFAKRQLSCNESNRKQAMIIDGGGYLENPLGTAPGLCYHDSMHSLIVIPGPPRENRPMIDEELPRLLKAWGLLGSKLHKQCLRLYSIGESQFTELSKDFSKLCYWGTYFSSEGYLDLHLSQWSDDEAQPQVLLEELDKVKELLDLNHILYTEKRDLGQLLLEELSKRGLTVSFAESLTGGILGSELVKWAGASSCFLGSITSYSNQSKVDLLGVSQLTINQEGEVSERCVEQMALGAKARFKSDISVAVSGIAGPSGGSQEKPLGLVHVAFALEKEVRFLKKIYNGDRNRVINQTKNEVYLGLYHYLKGPNPIIRKA